MEDNRSVGEKMVNLQPPGVEPMIVHNQKKVFATQLDNLHLQKERATKEGNEALTKSLETAMESILLSLRIILRR